MSGQEQTEPEEQHVKFSTDVGYFDKYIESLEALREEGIVLFKDNKIFSKVADPANVAMCISKIEGQALNSFNIYGADSMKAGLKFEKIRNTLSGTSNNSELEVTWPVTTGSSRYMRLDIIDEDIQFELSTLDPDTVPSIPQSDPLSHSTRVVVSGGDLKQAVKHADKIPSGEGGSVIFETFDGVFQLRAADKVEGRFTKQFHQSGPSDGDGLGNHQTQIGLKYLNDLSKMFGRGDEITVHVKDKNPVRFDVSIDKDGDAQSIYLIAPRLDKDG